MTFSSAKNGSQLSSFMDENWASFFVWRLMFSSTIVAFWPQLVLVLSKKFKMNRRSVIYLAGQRIRIACWLIVIELLVIQSLPLKLFE